MHAGLYNKKPGRSRARAETKCCLNCVFFGFRWTFAIATFAVALAASMLPILAATTGSHLFALSPALVL